MKTLKVLAVLAVMGVGVLGASTTADACSGTRTYKFKQEIQNAFNAVPCWLVTYTCSGGGTEVTIECNQWGQLHL